MQMTRPGAHAREWEDWMLGRGKITEMEGSGAGGGCGLTVGARLGYRDFWYLQGAPSGAWRGWGGGLRL